jgi:hypothetical protein
MGTLVGAIFFFGCTITGIVFLGVVQAREFAKSSAVRANKSEASEASTDGEMVSAVSGLAAVGERSARSKR